MLSSIRQICSLKTHLLATHVKDLILRLGLPRLVWCFRQEGVIRPLKKNYLNVNNRAISKSVLTRWSLVKDLKEYRRRQSPDNGLSPPSVMTGFGSVTVGRYLTLRSGEACCLVKVMGISADGVVTVEGHGDVFRDQERLLPHLNASPGQRTLGSAEDFAPCVIFPLSSGQMEIIKIASRLHQNLAEASIRQ